MSWRSTAFLLLLVPLYAGAAAHELAPQDFAYGVSLQATANAAAYRVTLPVSVYQKSARADLGDIRVFNADGKLVPYALQRQPVQASVASPGVPLPIFPLRGDPRSALEALRVTIESQGTAVNLQTPAVTASESHAARYVLDGRAMTTRVALLQLKWPDDAAEFAGRIEVEASDDLGSWRVVTESAPIVNLHANGKRLIEARLSIPEVKAKFWRLTFLGTTPGFDLTEVLAESPASRATGARARLLVFGVASRDDQAEFEFDLGARVPVDRVNIELPLANSITDATLLSRARPHDDWRAVADVTLYRLTTPSGEVRSTPAPISTNSDRFWLARLHDQSSAGARGPVGLAVEWSPDDLIFIPRGRGPFLLAYGSASVAGAEAPLASIPRGVFIAEAHAAAEQILGGEARRVPRGVASWRSAILWAVLACAVALLGVMAYRLGKEMNAGPGRPP